MSDPQRYTLALPEISYGMDESNKGEYVLWRDYKRLKAEVERLRKAGDAVALDYAERIEIEAGDTAKNLMRKLPVLREWNAAKEGRPNE